MGVVTGGGGGGAAFNGGTITQRLTLGDDAVPASLSLTPTDNVAGNSVEIMRMVAPAGYQNDNNGYFLQLFDEDGTVSCRIAEGGAGFVRSTAQGTADWSVRDANSSHVMEISPTGISQTGASVSNFVVDSGGNVTMAALSTHAIASGSLPTTTAFSSGTGKQIATRDTFLVVPVTYNPTAGAAATCVVALSPDNTTYSAVGTETEPAGVAFDGTIHILTLAVPAAWYVKLTVTNATIGTGTYY